MGINYAVAFAELVDELQIYEEIGINVRASWVELSKCYRNVAAEA
jgi:hypothetical protein